MPAGCDLSMQNDRPECDRNAMHVSSYVYAKTMPLNRLNQRWTNAKPMTNIKQGYHYVRPNCQNNFEISQES